MERERERERERESVMGWDVRQIIRFKHLYHKYIGKNVDYKPDKLKPVPGSLLFIMRENKLYVRNLKKPLQRRISEEFEILESTQIFFIGGVRGGEMDFF